MDSFTAHLVEEMPSGVGMPGARSSRELFITSLPSAELSELGLISHIKLE